VTHIGPLLIDTNVSSYLFNRVEPLAGLYRNQLRGHAVAIAAQTYAEHWYGAVKASWGEQRRAELRSYLARLVVIPTDVRLCELWGELRTAAERQGRSLSVQDAWVGATAVVSSLPLLCHDGDLHGLVFEGLRVWPRVVLDP
jgi:predicted nucleic acid-binding protein